MSQLKVYDEGDWKPVGEPNPLYAKAVINDMVYPIGSQYTNFTDSRNPALILGMGTWVAVQGRVVVGVDPAQVEFDTAEETGGAKTHTLTNSEMPVHSFNLSDHGDEGGSTMRTFSGTGGTTSGTWVGNYRPPSGVTGGAGSYANPSISWGANAPHNNLQPYITAYVWKRTA